MRKLFVAIAIVFGFAIAAQTPALAMPAASSTASSLSGAQGGHVIDVAYRCDWYRRHSPYCRQWWYRHHRYYRHNPYWRHHHPYYRHHRYYYRHHRYYR